MNDYSIKFHNECDIGVEKILNINDSKYQIFFGNKNADIKIIKEAFPIFEFYFLNQTHSSIILPASKESQTGDGHYSSEANNALCIKTADCLPVFIITAKVFFAIHAGWKGIENNIISKAGEITQFNDRSIAIAGPHIQQESFEVDEDVYKRLLLGNESIKNLYFEKNNKYHINLNLIAEKQFVDLGISPNNIAISTDDTFTNKAYNSFREDKSCGRNISFITKLN